MTPNAAADLAPLIGGGLVAYALVLAAAVALCTGARERAREAQTEDAPPAPPRPADPPEPDRTPEGLVAHVAARLGADAALFGWDLRADALCLLAATRPAVASGAQGRHLAREAVMAGCPARPPALVPIALAVPAERHDVRLGALCVSRDAGPPFTARERGLLVRLGALAADVLRERSAAATPAKEVPA